MILIEDENDRKIEEEDSIENEILSGSIYSNKFFKDCS